MVHLELYRNYGFSHYGFKQDVEKLHVEKLRINGIDSVFDEIRRQLAYSRDQGMEPDVTPAYDDEDT